MDRFMRCIRETFELDIHLVTSFIILNHIVYFVPYIVPASEPIFTQLTFKILPIVRHYIFTLLRMNFTLQPLSQTINVD